MTIKVSLEIPGNLIGVSEFDNKKKPITYILEKIQQIYSDINLPNVLIVQAKTGSGKSVFMTKEIHQYFRTNVIVSQPTILNSKIVPQSITQLYSGYSLGQNIGYKNSSDQVIPVQYPSLLFVTTQIMSLMLLNKGTANQQQFFIMDEAHHPSVQAEQLLVLLKDLSSRSNKETDPFIIITSATINLEKYMSYFSTNQAITVIGSTAQKIVKYPQNELENVYIYIYKTLQSIFQESTTNDDILIFCPSLQLINQLIAFLAVKFTAIKKLKFIPLMSADVQLETENFTALFQKATDQKWFRKIILASDVAETGVTIPTLKYVIDLGYNKFVCQNPSNDTKIIITIYPESKDSFEQRTGRIGRNNPGIAYATYPEILQQQLIKDFKITGLYTDYYYQLYIWLLEQEQLNQKYTTISPRQYDQEYRMHYKLSLLGFLNGNKVLKLGKLSAAIKFLTPNDLKFILLCSEFNIQGADAIGMILTRDFPSNQKYNKIILDQVIEQYIQFSKRIVLDNHLESDELRLVDILKKRQEIITQLINLGFNPFKGKSILTAANNEELLNYCRSIKQCLFYAYMDSIFFFNKETKNYQSLNGINISTIKVLNIFNIENEESAPQSILIQSVIFDYNQSLQQKIRIKGISILDGFINCDITIFNEYIDLTEEIILAYQSIKDLSLRQIRQRLTDYNLLCTAEQHPLLNDLMTQ